MKALIQEKKAAKARADWEKQRPDSAESLTREAVARALQNLSGRDFAADWRSGAENGVRADAAEAAARARDAAAAAVSDAAGLSGGYGFGYAARAAAQAVQRQRENLAAREQALRARARAVYDTDTDALAGLLAGLRRSDAQNAAKAQGELADWESMRDYLDSRYAQAAAARSENRNNALNALRWLLNTGVDVYDTYKGYKQQEWENDFRNDQFAWEQEKYADSQQRWQDEWDYKKERDALSDSRYDSEWDYKKERDALADARYDSEWSYKKARDAASDRLAAQKNQTAKPKTSNEGELTAAQRLSYLKAYEEALKNESPLAAVYAQILGLA